MIFCQYDIEKEISPNVSRRVTELVTFGKTSFGKKPVKKGLLVMHWFYLEEKTS